MNPYPLKTFSAAIVLCAMFAFTSMPLPLTLIEFTAVKTPTGKVELTWKTAQEVNTSYFSVERSTNGRDWKKLGVKTAKGEQGSITSYSFTDLSPAPTSNYYRLMVVDDNNKSDYSSVRLVTLGKEIPVRVYPTVALNSNLLYVEGISPELAQVDIYSNKGMIEYKAKLYSNTVSLSTLSTGIHYVRITNLKTMELVYTQKIIIH